MDDKTNKKAWTYHEAFQRNIGLVSKDEQEQLRKCVIGIPGLGGVGGAHLTVLARMGIENFHIADPDHFSIANINRQYGAFVSTEGNSKVDVMERLVYDINPNANIISHTGYIDASNVDTFINGCDVIVDSLDAYAIDARLLLFNRAYSLGVPVITAGPTGFATSMLVQKPGGLSLQKYLAIKENMGEREKFFRFMLGVAPSPHFIRYMKTEKASFKDQTGPCISSSIALCSGFAATEVLKIILKRGKVQALPHYHYFDPYLSIFKVRYMPFGNANIIQKIKLWYIKNFVAKNIK